MIRGRSHGYIEELDVNHEEFDEDSPEIISKLSQFAKMKRNRGLKTKMRIRNGD